MASVSSETLILFIASILVAASVAGTMTNGVDRLSNALGERSIDVSHQIRTDIAIISDPGAGGIYNGTTGTVTILVKNTGSGTLNTDPKAIDVLIDGQYETNVTVTVLDGTDWAPGNVVKLSVNQVAIQTGDHRAVVEVDGNKEVLSFRT